MKTPQYQVIYKDSHKSKVKYFGPFVSSNIAYNFCTNLPEPAPDGAKGVKIMSQFGYDEVHLAHAEIVSERGVNLFSFSDAIKIVHPKAA